MRAAFAVGLPGAQVFADHPYPNFPDRIPADYTFAESVGLPLWCSEGLGGPGTWEGVSQTAAQMAGCHLAIAWLN